jgi:hypothetical protein
VDTRTRNGIAFAGVAGLVAAGLVAVARDRKAPDLGPHALDAIPNGALVVATADLRALRASPLGAPFLREGREIKGLGKVRDVCGFDPIETLTEVAIAIPAAGEAGEFGLVATGPVDDEALLACAAKIIDARGGQAVTTTLGSFRAVRDASLTTSGGEIAVRKGGPLLLGAGAYLRAMVDAADGRTPTIRSSVAHAFLGRELGDAPLRVTFVLTPEQRRSLADELEGGGLTAGSLRAGGVGVTLGELVAVHAIASCETASACAAIATRLTEVRDARAHDLAIRLVGFGAVLERTTISAKGELVHARVEVPVAEAATLVDRVLALRGVRHPMPGASADPLAAPRGSAAADEVLRAAPSRADAGAAPVDGGAHPDGGAPSR